MVPKVDYSVGTNPYSLAVGDINADNKVDFASANTTSKTVSVLTNNGNGTFTIPSYPTCYPPGCNTDAPINVGSISQAKPAPFAVGTSALNAQGYIFSAINGFSYVKNIITKILVINDGTQANNRILTSDANGLASWKDAPSSIPTTPMTVGDFNLLVGRNKSVSGTIPSTYQYCALSKIGPDFANSNNSGSICAVNRNVDGTWTLSGTRGDDPDFYCNARCFGM